MEVLSNISYCPDITRWSRLKEENKSLAKVPIVDYDLFELAKDIVNAQALNKQKDQTKAEVLLHDQSNDNIKLYYKTEEESGTEEILAEIHVLNLRKLFKLTYKPQDSDSRYNVYELKLSHSMTDDSSRQLTYVSTSISPEERSLVAFIIVGLYRNHLDLERDLIKWRHIKQLMSRGTGNLETIFDVNELDTTDVIYPLPEKTLIN